MPVARYLQTPHSAALRAPLSKRSPRNYVAPAPLDQPIVGARVNLETGFGLWSPTFEGPWTGVTSGCVGRFIAQLISLPASLAAGSGSYDLLANSNVFVSEPKQKAQGRRLKGV